MIQAQKELQCIHKVKDALQPSDHRNYTTYMEANHAGKPRHVTNYAALLSFQ